MARNIFGWSYPPGCNSVPGDEEQAFDLTDGRTIKGYGRSDGLNGKDADLNLGGQNVVKEAWWLEDGTILINGRRYASIVPGEDWDDELMDVAAELVIGCSYPGEWDGDYWVLGEDYEIKTDCKWDDEQTEEENIKRACAVAVDAISKDSEAFESDMAELSKSFDTLEKDYAEYKAEQASANRL